MTALNIVRIIALVFAIVTLAIIVLSRVYICAVICGCLELNQSSSSTVVPDEDEDDVPPSDENV
jgi:hypothetical protein